MASGLPRTAGSGHIERAAATRPALMPPHWHARCEPRRCMSTTYFAIGDVAAHARGTLAQLSTNQGGSELTLGIKVGEVEFTTEALFAPVKKGSPVYKAAAELREGQCVVFSADKLEPSSMLEESKVCDLDYFANFTAMKPCP
jgi:hypothetical protein